MKAALVFLALAAAAQGQDADAVLRRGLALAREQRFEEAREALSDGARRYSGDKRFFQELAGVEYRLQNTRAAKGYLREALRRDPNDVYAADFLASLYLMDGNLPAALEYWNRIGRPLLDDVRFSPEAPLDPLLRDRTLAAAAGQVLTPERLERTQANLAFLEIFADCRFDLAPQAEDRADLTIRAYPKSPPLAGWGRALVALRGLPYQQVSVDFYNLRRRAINVVSLWRWDSEKRRIALALSGPAGHWRYRLAADLREENWDLRGAPGLDGLKLKRVETGAGLSRILTGRLTWTVGARVVSRSFRDGDGSSYFSNGLTAEIHNRFDSLLFAWPDERLRVEGFGSFAAGRILTGFPSRFASPRAGIRTKWLPQAKGERYTVTAEVRGGASFGNVPLDEMFTLGMERDNDLWLRGHVAARDGRKGNAPMGTRFVLAQTELAREIFRLPFVRLQAGPFFDAGRAGDPRGRFGSQGWLYDAGVQAKIGVIGGVTFTAVYGRNLRDGGGVFYTAVGTGTGR